MEHLESSGTKTLIEDLLYACYDEGAYCTPVMMRGPNVCQL